jgi:transcriptional regulator
VYIPEFNRIEDRDTSLAFLRAHPFAVLISSMDGLPFATHVPLAVTERSGQIVLRGHVAKANPHWKSFQQEQESLVIFQGPHAYISPALYEIRESVPTWNYAAVHVYGRVSLVDEKQAREILEALIAEFDSSYAAHWASLSEEYRSRMLRHIVAFEMLASRLETKFKLSQNRTRAEQANIVQALTNSGDSAAAGVAALMRQHGLERP